MHICKYEAIHEIYFMIAVIWKSTPRNIYTKQKNQNQPALSQEKICFILKIHYSSQIVFRISIKYFLTNNRKTKKEGRGWPFSRGCSFYMKKNIFTGKKFINMFFFFITKNLNWDVSTKNLLTFKRWDGVNDKIF